MDEQTGDAMNAARMQALHDIAMEMMEELCAPLSRETCLRRLESAIEQRAPGCGHLEAK